MLSFCCCCELVITYDDPHLVFQLEPGHSSPEFSISFRMVSSSCQGGVSVLLKSTGSRSLSSMTLRVTWPTKGQQPGNRLMATLCCPAVILHGLAASL